MLPSSMKQKNDGENDDDDDIDVSFDVSFLRITGWGWNGTIMSPPSDMLPRHKRCILIEMDVIVNGESSFVTLVLSAERHSVTAF